MEFIINSVIVIPAPEPEAGIPSTTNYSIDSGSGAGMTGS